jgi:hypothetical protein
MKSTDLAPSRRFHLGPGNFRAFVSTAPTGRFSRSPGQRPGYRSTKRDQALKGTSAKLIKTCASVLLSEAKDQFRTLFPEAAELILRFAQEDRARKLFFLQRSLKGRLWAHENFKSPLQGSFSFEIANPRAVPWAKVRLPFQGKIGVARFMGLTGPGGNAAVFPRSRRVSGNEENQFSLYHLVTPDTETSWPPSMVDMTQTVARTSHTLSPLIFFFSPHPSPRILLILSKFR